MKIKIPAFSILFFILSVTAFGQGKYYWQQEVDYTMDIDMDVSQHQFSGTQELVYTNNSPDTLRRVFYHLYFNAFQPGSMMDVRSRTIRDPDSRVQDRIYHLSDDEIGYQHINSLKQDGKTVKYEVDGTVLDVTLAEPILPGEEVTFNMSFEAQVPLQIRRTGWNNKEGVEYSMSQWYPKLAEYDEDGWHPDPYIAREFYGVWGSFDVSITLDSSYVMGATGFLQNPEEIGYGYAENYDRGGADRLTWHWKADRVHDFMWAADPDYVHTTAQVPDGPELHFLYQQDTVAENADKYSQQQLTNNWEQLPEYTVEAFKFMNEHFGKYPYDKFSVIQGGDGGMEYPMATLVTGNRSLGSLVGVTVHEFIHNWYYGVLASNEKRYPWMDEGFDTYAGELVMDHLFNNGQDKHPHQSSYQSYFRAHRNGYFEALSTHADHYDTNAGYSVAAYSTGSVFLNQLRYIVGDETFKKGMKRFFNVWKFKHPDGWDFLHLMEKQSGMVLDWYYEYFINSAKTIDYGIESVISEGSSTHVTLKRHDLMPMPIDLQVTYVDGSKKMFHIPLRMMRGSKPEEEGTNQIVKPDWPWVNPTYTLKLDASTSQIEKLELDPSMRLADINRDNNVVDLEEISQRSN